MFSAQKEELPNPFHHCFTFKVKDKTDVTMKLSGRLLAAIWIPGSFRRTTGKLFLGKNSLQLEGYFVPAQIKPLTGNFLQLAWKDYGNFNFTDWLFKSNTAYVRNFIRSRSFPLVEAVKADVISKNVVQVQYPSGRERTVSA